jgi:pimeloyl-ACP methyl ester carboxylesterase
MDITERAVTAADGRVLHAYTAGSDAAMPFVLHHGTPGSGLPFAPFVEHVLERDLRWVSHDRSGYGGSTRHEGRSVADCAADVAAILDAVGAGECYVAGWSGGGPHALACAALLPDRVRAAATIAGVGPYGVPDLDFLAGMGQENVDEFSAALVGGEPLAAMLEGSSKEVLAASVEELADVFGTLLPPVDRAAFTDEVAAYFKDSSEVAFRDGSWGWYDDDVMFVRDWGFDLGSIRAPIAVWQGELDKMVPFAHGRWLAANVPGARAHLHADHGHISIAVGSFARVVDDVVAMAAPRLP